MGDRITEATGDGRIFEVAVLDCFPVWRGETEERAEEGVVECWRGHGDVNKLAKKVLCCK